MTFKLLRLPEAISLIGLSRATFYKQVKDGLLPTQIHLGANSVAWLHHELEMILSARISGCSDSELKDMVSKIINNRKKLKDEI